jgi:hypothetical protein
VSTLFLAAKVLDSRIRRVKITVAPFRSGYQDRWTLEGCGSYRDASGQGLPPTGRSHLRRRRSYRPNRTVRICEATGRIPIRLPGRAQDEFCRGAAGKSHHHRSESPPAEPWRRRLSCRIVFRLSPRKVPGFHRSFQTIPSRSPIHCRLRPAARYPEGTVPTRQHASVIGSPICCNKFVK